ncbi:MAG: cyclase family protein [Bacteroidales bacterium]|nr:cyclase family protein [Bacteroidales bacterium]
MKIYDVSLTISQKLPVWPGDPPILLERVSKIEEGADANVTHIKMGAHVGTHVDAPFHFLGKGRQTVDQLSLSVLTGRAYVLRIPDEVKVITADVLGKANLPSRTRRLILKTRNSSYWSEETLVFQEEFVGLSPDGAQFIVDRGIRLVGIDYLSIAPFHQGKPTHQILLDAGIVIVEGLNLSEVTPGRYTLYCLPLKLAGSDGAPARTILVGV